MKYVSTITTLSLTALTLTACGGSTKSDAGRRVTRTPVTAVAEMDLPEVGWEKYKNGQYACTPGSTEQGCLPDYQRGYGDTMYSISNSQYANFINCVAADDGAYTPGNTDADYTASPSISEIVARTKHCCDKTPGITYQYGMDSGIPLPPTTGLTTGQVIINMLNRELFNYSCQKDYNAYP